MRPLHFLATCILAASIVSLPGCIIPVDHQRDDRRDDHRDDHRDHHCEDRDHHDSDCDHHYH